MFEYLNMAERPMRIDTHVHFLPDFYREELARTGHKNLDGMPAIPVSIFILISWFTIVS